MNILTHSPFLRALGWTLLNSLWQFGALWLIFFVFINIKKQLSPAVKHGFALLLMSAGFFWFAAGLSFRYFFLTDGGSQVNSFYLQNNSSYSFFYRTVKTFLENNLSYLSIFYLLIVASFFVRFFRFFFYSHAIQSRGLTKLRAELRLYVTQLEERLSLKRKVQVWISEYIDTPMVMGFLKPTILIPIACINQLSVKQLEAILLHELAHIKRNDYLVNLCIAIIEILFFFNPFARLLVRSIKQEREKCCDDWVLQFRFEPYQYASALLTLEKSRSVTYTLAMGAAGEKKNLLLQRVQRIMGIKKNYQESGFKLMAYFFTIGLLSFIALVNPGNLVVENFDKAFKEVKVSPLSYTGSFKRSSGNNRITLEPSPAQTNIEHKRKKETLTDTTTTEINTDEEDSPFMPVLIDVKEVDESPRVSLLQSIQTENKDFSIKDKDPEPPEVAVTFGLPYVPNSSYSFYNTDDSTLLKLKSQKNSDLEVRHSLAQAQKAIEKIDLNKIAKLQKLSKSATIKLQKELQKSLYDLNWSQIYKEAMDSLNNGNIEIMRSSLKKEYEKLNNYKAVQQQYQTIKGELMQQEDNYKNSIKKELIEIQKVAKKRKVIVYI